MNNLKIDKESSKMDPAVKDLLDAQNWGDLLPRLLKYSLYLIYAKTGGSSSRYHVSAGKMAEDFVMDAVMKVYRGERKWDPEKDPELLFYLMGVLRSLIGHEFQKLSSRQVVYLEGLGENTQKCLLVANVDVSKTEGFLSEFLKFIGDVPKVLRFTTFLAEGLKPREIADRMQLNPREIYNIRKVMKRRLCEFLNKNSELMNE